MWKVSDDIRKGMKNAAETIMAAESVYIFSHIVADGDALGSCAALCHALRMQGKEADILFEDEVPDHLRFLDQGYIIFADENTELPVRDQQSVEISEERKTLLSRGKKDGLYRSPYFPG